MQAKVQTSLCIEARFDEHGSPSVEHLVRIRTAGGGWLEMPMSAALPRLEREGVDEATIANIGSDAATLRMAIVNALLCRREVQR